MVVGDSDGDGDKDVDKDTTTTGEKASVAANLGTAVVARTAEIVCFSTAVAVNAALGTGITATRVSRARYEFAIANAQPSNPLSLEACSDETIAAGYFERDVSAASIRSDWRVVVVVSRAASMALNNPAFFAFFACVAIYSYCSKGEAHTLKTAPKKKGGRAV